MEKDLLKRMSSEGFGTSTEKVSKEDFTTEKIKEWSDSLSSEKEELKKSETPLEDISGDNLNHFL